MTRSEIRAGFDQMVSAATAAGDADAAARLEIAREFFTNEAFKRALQDHTWELTQARERCCGDAACYNESSGVPCVAGKSP